MKAEFSRIVPVDTIDTGAKRLVIEASATERAAVAKRLGLKAVDSLAADVTLEAEGQHKVWLRGTLRARVRQTCVVCLDSVSPEIEESFAVLYAALAGSGPEAEVLVGLGEAEAPEPLIGRQIDAGEAVTQQLILALDPYPRKPDAVVPAFSGDAERGSGTSVGGAFEVLAALKKDG